jgi:hypothetical protein
MFVELLRHYLPSYTRELEVERDTLITRLTQATVRNRQLAAELRETRERLTKAQESEPTTMKG